MKKSAPAAQRNRDPILKILRQVLPEPASVLEIASGTGEHAVYFAEHLPRVSWQPSDGDPGALSGIGAWQAESKNSRVATPIHLDVTQGPSWPTDRYDAVFCANMIHISPWGCTEGLLRGAAQVLVGGGQLVLYGPFMIDGEHTAPSNAQFDGWLKGQDPEWGVRDLSDVSGVAEQAGLRLEHRFEMPANNFVVVYRLESP